VNNLPTLRDVAERAGVSLASASYALGRSGRQVGDGTRTRVLRAADELGYEPRRRGRPLRRALTVGAIVPDAANPFFADVLRAAGNHLRANGHRLLATYSGEDGETEGDLLRLIGTRVDALMLVPTRPVGRDVRNLAHRMPVVLMDRDGDAPELASVALDNVGSARNATRALIESGHRRIAIVNGPSRVSTARDRLQGYATALQEAGIAVRETYVQTGEFSSDTGRQAVHQLFRLPEPPEAIFSSSPLLTSGILPALQEHGIRWPDEVAFIGYGDAVWASLVQPPLTIIEQPTAEMGVTAAGMILSHTRSPLPPRRIILSSRLVLRESHWRTRPPPAGPPAPAVT
jgi:DNA-binding LacI/PurR family transcriptional regulator